jgi:hypothetical protein
MHAWLRRCRGREQQQELDFFCSSMASVESARGNQLASSIHPAARVFLGDAAVGKSLFVIRPVVRFQ